ncbi:phage holin [Streptococcus sp. 263_SSPC]|uniref:phage holin n=1 Tax=Streptococcus sp. 263_SSPC TaxID=1579343 RepID=UPI000660DC8B
MNKINWKVRILNKTFWLTLVPALALLLQTFLAVFNVRLELGETIDKLLVFINALFAVLMIVGIVNDPTTAGLSDSSRALDYHEPFED